MTIKNFINRKTGVEADPMDAATLGEITFEELDTGNLYSKESSDLVLLQGPLKPEILENKTLDTETLNFSDKLAQDNPFNATNYKKKGWLIPAATPQGSVNGILEGVTMFNPNVISPTNDGLLVNFRSKVASEKLGFSSPVAMYRRGDGCEIKMKVLNSKVEKVLIGFASSSAFSGYSNVFFNNDIGVCVGFTASQSNWCAFYNDGAGTPATPDPFSIAKDELEHTIEIILSSANVIFKLDAETKTITSPIPSTTTNLYLHVYGVY